MSTKKIRYGKLKTKLISQRALLLSQAQTLSRFLSTGELFVDTVEQKLIFTKNGSLAKEDEVEVTPEWLDGFLIDEIHEGNQKVFDWAVENGLLIGGEEFVVVDG